MTFMIEADVNNDILVIYLSVRIKSCLPFNYIVYIVYSIFNRLRFFLII